jgi:hypothetical protein
LVLRSTVIDPSLHKKYANQIAILDDPKNKFVLKEQLFVGTQEIQDTLKKTFTGNTNKDKQFIRQIIINVINIFATVQPWYKTIVYPRVFRHKNINEFMVINTKALKKLYSSSHSVGRSRRDDCDDALFIPLWF